MAAAALQAQALQITSLSPQGEVAQVRQVRPGIYQPIEEKQYFALRLSGPATQASVLQNVWCSVEGRLAEAIRLRSASSEFKPAFDSSAGDGDSGTSAAAAAPRRSGRR